MVDNSKNAKKLTERKTTIILNGQLLTGESIHAKATDNNRLTREI